MMPKKDLSDPIASVKSMRQISPIALALSYLRHRWVRLSARCSDAICTWLLELALSLNEVIVIRIRDFHRVTAALAQERIAQPGKCGPHGDCSKPLYFVRQ